MVLLEIKEGKKYALEGANGRTFTTDQYAVLAHGKTTRAFPFVACSDSPFTEVCRSCTLYMALADTSTGGIQPMATGNGS